MFECDLHLHSIRSTCGYHTLLEIADIMVGKGFKGFALTDHGTILGTPWPHFAVLLKRLPPEVKGIRVFKGVEASVLSVDGDIDMPVFEGFPYEIVLAGLHSHDLFAKSQGEKSNTDALVNAMKRHPFIKTITHPCFKPLPVDMDRLTDAAAETGTALEINNARLAVGRVDIERLARMIELSKMKGVSISVNSDGHVFSEMGNFEPSEKLLHTSDIQGLNIVNRTMESTLDFLELES